MDKQAWRICKKCRVDVAQRLNPKWHTKNGLAYTDEVTPRCHYCLREISIRRPSKNEWSKNGSIHITCVECW